MYSVGLDKDGIYCVGQWNGGGWCLVGLPITNGDSRAKVQKELDKYAKKQAWKPVKPWFVK
jgi:hypothetical protein